MLCRLYRHDNLIQLIKFLLAKGADVNAKTPDGRNPLHLLCEHYEHDNLLDFVVLLKNNSIDLKAKTKEGYAASHILQNTNPAANRMIKVIEFPPSD